MIDKFKTFEGASAASSKVFYKIVDKGKENVWLDKKFKKDKKTLVTTSKSEVGQINTDKTAVKLTNVPSNCIIDTEGNWVVIEPFLGKSEIKVEKF